MDDTLRAAVDVAMDAEVSKLFALFQVAAIRNPGLLRELLDGVYDLSEVRSWMWASKALARSAHQDAVEARDLIAAVNKDFEALEKRLDAILYAVEQLENRVDRLIHKPRSVAV